MGQPINCLRSSSASPNLIRYELNRSLTGMGHEHYRAGKEIFGDNPGAELARRLLATGRVATVHLYASMLTLELLEPDDSGFEEIIADLHTYYVPGVEIPSDAELMDAV